jgi:glycosyltransferase involved in cell wall biosynthesis
MPNKKLTVMLDTTPLTSGHAHRGIGMYTQALSAALSARDDIQLVTAVECATQQLPPDLIHYPYFDLFYPTLPFHFRQKAIITIHDVIPLLFPEHHRPGKRGMLNLYRQKTALKCINGVITVSETSKADITAKLGVPAEKIFVAHNAGNPAIQAQSPAKIAAAREKYALPDKYVLYVGDINYNKNIPQLIKMVKFLPDAVQLVCVGKNFRPHDIPEWNWIETQLALSDVVARVQFLATIPSDEPAELAAIYSGAEAYVQPSLYEGFGLPVVEAMQCKCPVVSSNRGALPEVAGEHALFSEPIAEPLAEQVKTVLEWSKAERVRRTNGAQKWAAQYSWEQSAASTVACYKAIASKEK